MVFRWDEIARAYQNVTRHYTQYRRYLKTSFSFRMVRTDNVETTFVGSFKDPELSNGADTDTEGLRLATFGQQACDQVSRALLPAALETLARGEDVDFRGLALNVNGIRHKDALVPWRSIEEVTVKDGVVTIKHAGKFLALTTRSVGGFANFGLFMTLINELRRG